MSIIRTVVLDGREDELTFNNRKGGLFINIKYKEDFWQDERCLIIEDIETLERLKFEIDRTIKELS